MVENEFCPKGRYGNHLMFDDEMTYDTLKEYIDLCWEQICELPPEFRYKIGWFVSEPGYREHWDYPKKIAGEIKFLGIVAWKYEPQFKNHHLIQYTNDTRPHHLSNFWAKEKAA